MRAFLVLSLLLACTPKDEGDEATATTSAGPATDASTSDPTGGTCVDPAMTEFGPGVAITIRNDGDIPLFIPTQTFCADVLPVTLFAGDAPIQISPGLCDFPCGASLTGECGCPLGCGDPSDVVQIFPGGVYTDAWSGVSVVPFEIDPACIAEGCEPTCTAQLQTPPGSYTLRATASEAVNNCDPTCTCTPNSDGWCIFEADPSGASIVAEAALDYPTQTAAMLTFD